MASILKVNTIQDTDGNNIINENANVITIGASGDTITVPAGATVSGFTSAGIDDNATSTAITINSSEQVAFTDGTASLPSITNIGDSDTGIFFPAADTIAFSEGGVEAMRINSSGILNTGKVIVRKDGASETEQLVILNQSVDSNADLHFKGYAYRDRARIRAVDSSSSATGGSMKIETSGGTSTDGSSLETRILLDKNGNISFYEDTGTTPKMFWDATNERLGVGTTSPSAVLDVRDETNGANFIVGGSGTTNITKIGGGAGDSLQLFTNSTTPVMLLSTSGNVGIGTTSPGANLEISSGSYGSSNHHQQWSYNGTPFVSLYMDAYASPYFDTDSASSWNPGATMVWKRQGSEKMRITSDGNVGIGTSSPEGKLHVQGDNVGTPSADADDLVIEKTVDTGLSILSTTTGRIFFGDASDNDVGSIRYVHTDDSLRFNNNASESMRIDSSGNLLVGTTSNDKDSTGASLRQAGDGYFTRNDTPLYLNRLSADGEILRLSKDGTTMGYVSTIGGTDIFFGSGDTGLRYRAAQDDIRPSNGTADRDNAIDLGDAGARFDDIFATNGTIQTSDQNEKQSIQSLTTAEMNVAKRLSQLIKTFKWNSAVEEKGASARTHTGIIAQDVQQAFTDEELDATNYALFISSTWWENSDGDVKEEATDGYNEKTRLGVRYPELLSFIQAYNDQRFTELEARITALETNNP